MITISTQAASWPRESEARRRTMSTIATIQATAATNPRNQSQSTVQPYGFSPAWARRQSEGAARRISPFLRTTPSYSRVGASADLAVSP